VKPKHFAEHAEILRKHYRPASLSELVAGVADGGLPDRTLAITFDDGYADNLYNAKPMLEAHDLPATVFVATGYTGHDREFWWDELEALLLQPGRLPETLVVEVGRKVFRWELQADCEYDSHRELRHRSWNVERKDNPSLRHGLYRSLCKTIRPLREETRRDVLHQLRAWSGGCVNVRRSHRLLSAEELSVLGEGEFIELGAHSVTHPVLAVLPVSAQWQEIQHSKHRLEEIAGRNILGFAYPYGSRSDFTPETIALVRKAGFGFACANVRGLVRRKTDPFQLPRLLVRDWDGEAFRRLLKEWFGD
jgi:peptidoglycan/xylan/chitin deacetylase (PgdA/CDA1 family)